MAWMGMAELPGAGAKVRRPARSKSAVPQLPNLLPPSDGEISAVAAIARGHPAEPSPVSAMDHPSRLVGTRTPVYSTGLGAAYATDSLSLMRSIPSGSVAAVITSPPYALEFKKEYGNVNKTDYIDWLVPFAREIKRILAPIGS
jgi:hypothetical protein